MDAVECPGRDGAAGRKSGADGGETRGIAGQSYAQGSTRTRQGVQYQHAGPADDCREFDHSFLASRGSGLWKVGPRWIWRGVGES